MGAAHFQTDKPNVVSGFCCPNETPEAKARFAHAGPGRDEVEIRALPAMSIGIFISVLSIYMLGMNMNGWWTLLAIGIFSFGEMTASPTQLRYMASIAPPGKKGDRALCRRFRRIPRSLWSGTSA